MLVKSISCSTAHGHTSCTLREAAQHNLRELPFTPRASYDPSLSHNNVIMDGPSAASEVEASAATALRQVVGLRLKRDHCQAIEFIFSLRAMSPLAQLEPYFAQCLEWLKTVTRLPVLSAVLHLDEAAPHLHVLLLPVRDSAHVGSMPINRKGLKSLQASFDNAIATPAGLGRQRAKFVGAVKKAAAGAVLQRFATRGWPEMLGPVWPVLKDVIEQKPTDFAAALSITEAEIRAAMPPPRETATPAKSQGLPCVGLAQPKDDGQSAQPSPHHHESRAAAMPISAGAVHTRTGADNPTTSPLAVPGGYAHASQTKVTLS